MANLITACADCNLGKHDVLLTAQAQPRSKRIQPAPFSSNAKIQADLRSQG